VSAAGHAAAACEYHGCARAPALGARRTGRCEGRAKGSCPYVHDAARVAVCPRWLAGGCAAAGCPLQHRACPELMPICAFFLQARPSAMWPAQGPSLGRPAGACTDGLHLVTFLQTPARRLSACALLAVNPSLLGQAVLLAWCRHAAQVCRLEQGQQTPATTTLCVSPASVCLFGVQAPNRHLRSRGSTACSNLRSCARCGAAGPVQQRGVRLPARQAGPARAPVPGVPARLLRRRRGLPAHARHAAHAARAARVPFAGRRGRARRPGPLAHGPRSPGPSLQGLPGSSQGAAWLPLCRQGLLHPAQLPSPRWGATSTVLGPAAGLMGQWGARAGCRRKRCSRHARGCRRRGGGPGRRPGRPDQAQEPGRAVPGLPARLIAQMRSGAPCVARQYLVCGVVQI